MSAPWVKTDFTPIPKVSSLKKEAADDKAKDAAWAKLCRYIDRRDGLSCRACGRRVTPMWARVENRRECHHIVPRSRGGESTKENCLVLCALDHDAVHVTRELSITGSAEGRVTFTRGGQTWRG